MMQTQGSVFSLQGRTVAVRVNGTDNTNATVWGGFAMKADDSDQVQVIMNKNRDGKSSHIFL